MTPFLCFLRQVSYPMMGFVANSEKNCCWENEKKKDFEMQRLEKGQLKN